MSAAMQYIYHSFPVAAALLYTIAAVQYVRLLNLQASSGRFLPRRYLNWGVWCHLLFFLFTVSGLYLNFPVGVSGRQVVTGFPFTLSLVSFIAVTVFLILDQRFKISVLGAFIAPIAVLFVVWSAFLFHYNRSVSPQPINGGLALVLHIVTAVAANSAFLLAFAVSAALIIHETILKRKTASPLRRILPSIVLLDRLNVFFLTVGFLLMLGSVAVGFFIAANDTTAITADDPRMVTTFATLGIYAVLLVARFRYDWRGRRLAWLSVAGFAMLVGSFVLLNLLGRGFHVF